MSKAKTVWKISFILKTGKNIKLSLGKSNFRSSTSRNVILAIKPRHLDSRITNSIAETMHIIFLCSTTTYSSLCKRMKSLFYLVFRITWLNFYQGMRQKIVLLPQTSSKFLSGACVRCARYLELRGIMTSLLDLETIKPPGSAGSVYSGSMQTTTGIVLTFHMNPDE